MGLKMHEFWTYQEPITSKDTVSNEALVLTKSRFEEGSQKLEDLTLKSHKEWDFLQEHSL